ncbi:MAG TPA: hypothetical protein VFM54_16010 [Micromonosporaceae bacterium]|nr:hypothetical protein [Micromonosporaceae bacterium]
MERADTRPRTSAELVPAAGAGGAAAQLLARVTARPVAAPELLAQAAVAEYGPRAQAWAELIRATYPGAPADGVARLAVQRYTRLARGAGAAAVLGGRLGPVAGASALGMLQAQVVLHIAAAYGVDPTAPERVPELLALASAFRGAEEARTAAGGRAAVTARAATPLLRAAGAWMLWQAAGRLLPGAGVLLGAHSSADAIRRLAVRAAGYYRTASRT